MTYERQRRDMRLTKAMIRLMPRDIALHASTTSSAFLVTWKDGETEAFSTRYGHSIMYHIVLHEEKCASLMSHLAHSYPADPRDERANCGCLQKFATQNQKGVGFLSPSLDALKRYFPMIAVNRKGGFYGHPPKARSWLDLQKISRPTFLLPQLTRAEKNVLVDKIPYGRAQHLFMAHQIMARQAPDPRTKWYAEAFTNKIWRYWRLENGSQRGSPILLRRINAINAVTAFCGVEEGRPTRRIESRRRVVPDDDEPIPAAKRRRLFAEDETGNALQQAIESARVDSPRQRPQICFLCLGNPDLPLKDRLLRHTTPGSLTRHFLRKHVNPPWPTKGVTCEVCDGELLQQKSELLNHAELSHGTVVGGTSRRRLAQEVNCQLTCVMVMKSQN
ncbi:hypothetical protein FE257_008485 [Aspergillus nanangensis]|uniref:C2H2-type domain-containing protein n=1 Tax=Aspergillus nanangensis TaxID=2582783 RepID=A0AAD4GSJ4_ASPNN|nr:hypothetical protein FE257_008485 [Aspergillus nanangensis]